MSFTSGQTGIERGVTQFLFSKEPKVITRYREGGIDRVVAMSVPGTPIVCEYEPEQARRKLVLRCEAVTASEMDDLLTLMDDTGPVSVKYEVGGSTISCVFGARDEQSFEPVFGDYPESAPSRITYWRAQITVYRLE